MQQKEPELSIIIPVWNGERRIVMTLDAIAKQTVTRDRFEVIVVDNGSTDGTAAAGRKFDFVTLLSEPIPSSYRARNRGLAAARGRYVLFTDGDCVPAVDWVEQAFKVLQEHPDAGLYAGEIKLFREKGAGKVAPCYEELTAFNQADNVAHGHCVTANWLCLRDDLIAIGSFNQDLLSGGDVECSRRMVAAGHKLIHAKSMIVAHPTRATLGELIRKRRRVIGGRWRISMSQTPTHKILWQLVREAKGQARWIVGTKLDGGTKAGLLGIIAVLMFVSQVEVCRLSFGRPPYRS